MIVYIVAMIAILAVAAAVVGLVLVGMEGRGGERMPWIADKLTRAARHLNGEVEPPETFARMVERTRLGRDQRKPSGGEQNRRDEHREPTPAGR